MSITDMIMKYNGPLHPLVFSTPPLTRTARPAKLRTTPIELIAKDNFKVIMLLSVHSCLLLSRVS